MGQTRAEVLQSLREVSRELTEVAQLEDEIRKIDEKICDSKERMEEGIHFQESVQRETIQRGNIKRKKLITNLIMWICLLAVFAIIAYSFMYMIPLMKSNVPNPDAYPLCYIAQGVLSLLAVILVPVLAKKIGY